MFLQLTGINTPQEDSYTYSKAKATFMKHAKYQQNIDAKNTIHIPRGRLCSLILSPDNHNYLQCMEKTNNSKFHCGVAYIQYTFAVIYMHGCVHVQQSNTTYIQTIPNTVSTHLMEKGGCKGRYHHTYQCTLQL